MARTQPDPALTSTYRICMPRGMLPQEFTSSATRDRVIQKVFTRTRGVTPLRVKVVFANRGISNNSADGYGEISPPNNITIRATWERLDTGELFPCTFNGGASSATLTPGDIIETDAMEGGVWAGTAGGKWRANTAFSLNIECVVPVAGNSWPAGWRNSCSITNTLGVAGTRTEQVVACDATLGADQINVAGALTTAGGNTGVLGFPPAAIIGEYALGDVGLPAVVWTGNSITDLHSGLTQHNYFSSASGNDGNFVEQALRTRTYPYSKMAIASGQMLRGWQADATLQKYVLKFASHWIIEDATNELQVPLTAATLYGYERGMIQDALVRGVRRIIATTTTPRTGSTNSWIDAAGQSTSGSFVNGGARDLLSALRRSGIGSATGYDQVSEVSAAVEDAGDHTIWKTTGVANVPTTDGLHPTNAWHKLMSPVLETSMVGWTLAGGI